MISYESKITIIADGTSDQEVVITTVGHDYEGNEKKSREYLETIVEGFPSKHALRTSLIEAKYSTAERRLVGPLLGAVGLTLIGGSLFTNISPISPDLHTFWGALGVILSWIGNSAMRDLGTQELQVRAKILEFNKDFPVLGIPRFNLRDFLSNIK